MVKKVPNEIFFAEVERLISEGSEVRLKVIGTSMRPFLRNGDTVSLAPCSGDGLRPGMIVLFRHNGRHILHRIKERDGDELVIQGDSVPTVEKAAAADVIATVKEVIKPDGSVVSYGSCRWNREHGKLLRRRKIRAILSRVKRRIERE